MLLLHLFPDTEDMFGSAINFTLQFLVLHALMHRSDKIFHVLLTIEPFFFQLRSDFFVNLWMQIAKRQIFKFPFQLTNTQAVSQRAKDRIGLFGRQHPSFLVGIFYIAQVTNLRSQLNHHGAHIFDHCQQHLA